MTKRGLTRFIIVCAFILLMAIPLACDQGKDQNNSPTSSPIIKEPWSESANCGICHVFEAKSGSDRDCISVNHALELIPCLACHENKDSILSKVHANYASAKPATALKETSVSYPTNKTYNCYSKCHSLAELKEKNTQKRDPHDNHNLNQNCNVCHKLNEPSVLWCSQCHAELVIPEGWLTYKEWNDLKKATTK